MNIDARTALILIAKGIALLLMAYAVIATVVLLFFILKGTFFGTEITMQSLEEEAARTGGARAVETLRADSHDGDARMSAIGVIGGSDGPTHIWMTTKLAPDFLLFVTPFFAGIALISLALIFYFKSPYVRGAGFALGAIMLAALCCWAVMLFLDHRAANFIEPARTNLPKQRSALFNINAFAKLELPAASHVTHCRLRDNILLARIILPAQELERIQGLLETAAAESAASSTAHDAIPNAALVAKPPAWWSLSSAASSAKKFKVDTCEDGCNASAILDRTGDADVLYIAVSGVPAFFRLLNDGDAVGNLQRRNRAPAIALDDHEIVEYKIHGENNFFTCSELSSRNPDSTLESGNRGTQSLVVLNDADNFFAGTIKNGKADALRLIKLGAGKLTLAGTNAYSGGTIIASGSLEIFGSVASAVTINRGSIEGAGTVHGDLIINAGATLLPDCPTPFIAGKIALNGALEIAGIETLAPAEYTLFTCGGGIADNSAEIANLPAGADGARRKYNLRIADSNSASSNSNKNAALILCVK
jgi:autotransporter-associated beta strand repeat